MRSLVLITALVALTWCKKVEVAYFDRDEGLNPRTPYSGYFCTNGFQVEYVPVACCVIYPLNNYGNFECGIGKLIPP